MRKSRVGGGQISKDAMMEREQSENARAAFDMRAGSNRAGPGLKPRAAGLQAASRSKYGRMLRSSTRMICCGIDPPSRPKGQLQFQRCDAAQDIQRHKMTNSS
eukprot:5515503-Pleurochrysis_carterae.AAC.2